MAADEIRTLFKKLVLHNVLSCNKCFEEDFFFFSGVFKQYVDHICCRVVFVSLDATKRLHFSQVELQDNSCVL